MDSIKELIELSDRYNSERLRGHRNSRINTYEYIDLYLNWYSKSKSVFEKYFDKNDASYCEFCSYSTNSNGHGFKNSFTRQLPIFNELIERIKKDSLRTNMQNEITNKCFLIHGHNEILKWEVVRLVEREFRIEVVILHEQLNSGQTIIEKFEANSTVDFAIALWTQDDEGRKKGTIDFRPRARQNVVFETGYFFGQLGRSKVIVLNDPEIEIPSDNSGIVYIPLNENWKYHLISEIKGICEAINNNNF